ncbi:hypothetical protein BaRGS_00002058 [Batillaria attramentaria]|uniref:Uncharacterized protein n=1 Tax=Batillaria attramentaria TaxID=370345 RepID=A0ABD0M5Y7_9CAEN
MTTVVHLDDSQKRREGTEILHTASQQLTDRHRSSARAMLACPTCLDLQAGNAGRCRLIRNRAVPYEGLDEMVFFDWVRLYRSLRLHCWAAGVRE